MNPYPTDSRADLINDGQQYSPALFIKILTGLGLFGLLVTSCWEFGGFAENDRIFYRTELHGGNYKLMSLVSLLLEGKMSGLLALVFGAGILYFFEKKKWSPQLGFADAHIRRMMWLMAFGVFNAFILIWPGDILFSFGVVGILVFGFTRMGSKGFLVAALVCTLIYCGKQYWYYHDDRKAYKKYSAVLKVEEKFKADSLTRAKKDSADRSKDTVLMKDVLAQNKKTDSLARKNDTLTNKQADDKGSWEGIVKYTKYDSTAKANANKLMRASWRNVAYNSIRKSQQKESAWLYRTGIWEIAALLFLGMALFRLGFFHGRFSSSKYCWIAAATIIAGLGLAWFRVHLSSVRNFDYQAYVKSRALPYNIFFPIERVLLVTGYAAGMIWIARMRWKIFNWFLKALAVVGSLGLTNYLLQTVICTLFFNGYGFSYYGHLNQWQIYFFVAEVILAQIVFSVAWLRYYQVGPVEWLWHCAVNWKWERIPKKVIEQQREL